MDAFKAKYPTRDACLDAHADQAGQILETCKTADDPRACVHDAVGAPEDEDSDAPAHAAVPHARRPVLAGRVAAALCRAELRSSGREAFRAKYRTPGACMKASAARAAAIVTDAQTQCATAVHKPQCVHAAIAKALGLRSHLVRS